MYFAAFYFCLVFLLINLLTSFVRKASSNPTPYTLPPTPYPLHPTPYTLHPNPYPLPPAP